MQKELRGGGRYYAGGRMQTKVPLRTKLSSFWKQGRKEVGVLLGEAPSSAWLLVSGILRCLSLLFGQP